MSQRRWLLLLVVLCAFASPAFGQTVEWVDESGQPLSQAYEFSNPRLRATDGGSAGLGSLTARVTSDLRGDEEWVYLWEDTNNPGVFTGQIYAPGTLATDPPSPDGVLEVTENPGPPHQRDTIRAFLENCSTPPCPADAVPMIGSTIRLTDSQWMDIDSVFPGQPVSIEVADHGAPYWAPTTATVMSQSGDSETVSLTLAYEDPYTPILGLFRGSIDVEIGSAVPGDGRLQVQGPDTITASHPDPLGLSSSADSAAVVTAQIEFLDRSGNAVDALMVGGDIRLRALYPAGNANPAVADTVTVTVRSRQSTGSVRDTESLQLFESGPDTAVFSGEMPSFAHYWTVPGDGVLQVWVTNWQNDTVEVTLASTTATTTLIPSILRIVDASGTDVTNIPESGTIYLRLEAGSNDPAYQDSLQARVLSLTTGDQEYVNLQETGLDTSLFAGSLPTSSAASPVSGNGQLEVQLGETIRASHDTFFGAAVDLAVSGEGTPSSNPPNAVDDAATTPDDLPVSINVLANDSDADGHDIQVFGFTQGAQGGTVWDDGGGVLTYAPPPYFTGTDTFLYRLRDEIGDEDLATVTVTVEFVNDPPSANDDAFATDEDQPALITPTDNDHDPENQAVRIIAVTQGSKGAAAIYDAELGYVSYTPNPNANGNDSFTYTIQDPQGATGTATVSVTINPQPDPPVAVSDAGTTAEDTATTISVLANDSDPDGDTLSVIAVTQGTNGAVTFTAGSVQYTPAPNANGSDAFTYTIADGNGGTASTTAAITINAVNDAPDGVNDAAETNEDAAVTLSVLANDADVDGEAVILTGVWRRGPTARSLRTATAPSPTRRTRTASAPTLSPTPCAMPPA